MDTRGNDAQGAEFRINELITLREIVNEVRERVMHERISEWRPSQPFYMS